MRDLVHRAVKANVVLGGVGAAIAAVSTFVLLRIMPRTDFASYAAVLSASGIGVVIVEGGLTMGLARYLPEAQRQGHALDLYKYAWRRRGWSVLLGVALLCLWGWSGLSHHKLLDGHIGRGAWALVSFVFLGDICLLLPFSALQALFEFRSSLGTRAVFALLRFGAVWALWTATQDIRWVLVGHAVCSCFEGAAYHLLLRARLTNTAHCEVAVLRATVRYGWYSIAEKGAHAGGGINTAFILLGYLLPIEALGAIAAGKELAQKFVALAVLPLNGVANSVLNWNAGRTDLPAAASKLFSLQSALLAVAGVGILYSMGWAVALAGVNLSETAGQSLSLILGGMLGEYALRFDLVYRFRSGMLRSAVVWAYAAAVAGLAGLVVGTGWGGAACLATYYLCRLGVLAGSFIPNLSVRYQSAQVMVSLSLIASFLLCAGLRAWNAVLSLQLLGVAGCALCGVWFALLNREWLLVRLRRTPAATKADL